ncbi:hypothetical protein HBI56_205900 [Parastagonospora nodorum]|uniref:SnoaL-like domain-containing protein n=2 Tax=Phaeosphaeria nodorum (strain SN15 / ATCC MYA-4574 / FGSC 10173) TaxID=321614 RepID=A0A7U2I7P6_PHANO|nr:hypothetical protein SNOG_10995 [Parastagonospora nodorum SN15]KAH3912503.1 hypothetical protein HBH56_115910 [Parastagonospora nodorum]EAT81494.2 hypothetical protein SNOG_10995 [Parastagonospora nodorum SN15]KAH3928873.1 hypothetical protein HBH54_133240 [Parastagonospora nodorum]KAH3950757.1 hypothetical protein HBH53_073540 [Parastagonospora nodorum]KAH3998462.1 hypothetical protein HBI10_125230 [Parastagonospora nodorum]
MSSLAAQKATAKAVIAGFDAWELEKIMAYRHPDCQIQVIPASLGRPKMNNAEYRVRLAHIMPWFRNFKATVHTEVHDAEAHTCMIHATSTAETDIGPYANEYALILTFTEDGTKVINFLEMVDSAYSSKFFAALAEAGLK